MQMKSLASRRAVVTAIATVQLLSIALWAGGLLALGALVAPVVFRVVPPPTNADAMTLIFHRFDSLAIACGAVALIAEAAFAARGGAVTRADVARGLCLAGAVALALAIGLWLAPGIADLHHSGAARRVGDAGLALDRLHRFAEAFAKGELLLLFAAFVLAVGKAARPLR